MLNKITIDSVHKSLLDHHWQQIALFKLAHRNSIIGPKGYGSVKQETIDVASQAVNSPSSKWQAKK